MAWWVCCVITENRLSDGSTFCPITSGTKGLWAGLSYTCEAPESGSKASEASGWKTVVWRRTKPRVLMASKLAFGLCILLFPVAPPLSGPCTSLWLFHSLLLYSRLPSFLMWTAFCLGFLPYPRSTFFVTFSVSDYFHCVIKNRLRTVCQLASVCQHIHQHPEDWWWMADHANAIWNAAVCPCA